MEKTAGKGICLANKLTKLEPGVAEGAATTDGRAVLDQKTDRLFQQRLPAAHAHLSGNLATTGETRDRRSTTGAKLSIENLLYNEDIDQASRQ